MTVLKILEIPDVRLRRKAKAVVSVTADIRTVMNDMAETLYACDNSVGLAATQVGIGHRLLVIDAEQTDKGPGRLYKMANPEIVWFSEEKMSSPEGCFSVPGCYADVMRSEAVHATYLDENNQPQKVEATGLLAACIQHEIDHLDGILFIDHLSSLKRERILKKLQKIRRLSA